MKFKTIVALFFTILIVSVFGVSVSAEGSKSLNSNGGNRVYTEWDNGRYTAGIERTTILSVYAQNGEKLYLGSSIFDSFDSHDIVITAPDGDTTVLDVTKDGTGLIDSYKKEQAGPSPLNADGYTPLSYPVRQTGIYTVEFHSFLAPTTKTTVPNPVHMAADKFPTTQTQQSRCVAAWDITVCDSRGNEITGRVFTYYLALNVGEHNLPLNASVYVLTKDGYIYKIDLDGIQPYGFIMYANNRGLVDATSQTSLYKNAISPTNEMTTLLGNVIAPRPDLPDTDKSYTHYVFFSEPAADLPESMPTSPLSIAEIGSFAFDGISGNTTTVATGGYFTVEFSKKTTYKLVIDTNKDGVFDENDVNISDAASAGLNKIYWNGKDSGGNAIPAGDYDVRLYTKGGEYHFPLIDVETCSKGISIELLNDERVSGDDAFTVYYDNTSYTTADGTNVNTNPDSKLAIKPANALGGVNSKDGAYAYGLSYGDQKAFDIWTYTLGNEASATLKVVEGVTSGTISGDVFFDSDKDALFGANETGLAGIEVTITAKDGTKYETVTDDAGKYAITAPLGEYTVEVKNPLNNTLTTDSNSFKCSLTAVSSNSYLSSVGYFCDKDIAINVTANTHEVETGSNIVFTATVTNTTEFDLSGVTASIVLPSYTEFLSDTSSGKYDASTGKLAITSLASGESYTFTIKVKTEREGDYTVYANANCTADSNESNNSSSVDFTVEDPIASITVPSYSKPYTLESNFAYIFGYDDITMAAENDMKVGECCAVIYRLLKQNGLTKNFDYDANDEPIYPEFSGRWDRSAAEYMIFKGIYSDELDVFDLERPITRQEAFKLFAVALGFTNNTELTFEQYALILHDAGYIDGDEKGNFNLADNIKRAEVCKVYNMIIKRDRLDLEDKMGKTISSQTYGFTDLSKRAWYYEIMLKATSAYDENGFVDISKRGIRNQLDDFE